MAQHVEPMDIDSSVCDFDDKENAFHHNNAQARTPCTEKGYEELDVSELNMKLRYSVTPAASPMSKSYAGNCFDNKTYEIDNTLDSENGNMTRSLHTTLTKNDTFNKTQKTLPLQSLPTDLAQVGDGNRNVLRPLDSTATVDNNITVTLTGANDIDENLSLPSSSSSMTHTPEATTPTKEIPKGEPGSPIIRGLKSVLNMFRPSQSPITGEEDAKLETLSPPIVNSPETRDEKSEIVSASTPLAAHKTKDPLCKINSPKKESIVFNEDLENELEWKDDSTIIFSNEKVPIHKLFFQLPKNSDAKRTIDIPKAEINDHKNVVEGKNLNASIEYMDISYNDSGIMDKTATATKILSELNKSEVAYTESDSEFVDAESTFTRNDSYKSQVDNELNSTEDVLSHINDLVEAKTVNASLETLNASDAKSADLTSASTETTKQNDSLLTIANTTHEEQKKEKIQAKIAATEATPTVSDKIEIDSNNLINKLVTDLVNSNSNINETIVVSSPVLENMGVKSLSQIPLIADPRILLFNIPSDVNNVIKDAAANEVLKTSPADIPLPEDDDISALPGMNSELENLSHTLDKIAEEIPKINQHESSVSSIGSLSDHKCSESPTPDNVFLPVLEENTAINASCENIPTLNIDYTETSVKTVEISESIDKIPDINVSSENQAWIESVALPPVISKNINAPVTSTDIQTIPEVNTPVSIYEVVNSPVPAVAETKTLDANKVLPTTAFDNTESIFNSENPCSEIDNKVVIPDKIGMLDAAPVFTNKQAESSHVIPEPEHIMQKGIHTQIVEPMDVSIAEIQVTTESDETQKSCSKKELEVSSSLTELGSISNKSEDFANAKENEFEINSQIKTPALNQIPSCEGIFNSSEIAKETERHILENNIYFIKQEVDAIVAKAIDIATEKTTTKNDENILNDKIYDDLENYDISAPTADVTIDIEKNTAIHTEFEQVQTESKNNTSKHIELTKAPKETDVMSSDEEADIQQKLLNQMSANKYSYTVQDIPVTIMNNKPADAFCTQEASVISTDDKTYINPLENVEITNIVEEMEIEKHKKNEADKTSEVTPPDMVNVNVPENVELNKIIKGLEIQIQKYSDDKTLDVTPLNMVNANSSENVKLNNVMDEMEIQIQNDPEEEKTLDVTPPDMVKIDPITTTDEEIVASENNSPFVSVSHELEDTVEVKPIENFDEIENPFATKSKIIKSPPASPKIVSKGYNFNFDEIDDPFATKTKIRMSPALDAPPDTYVELEPPKKEVNKNNRRRSQPDRKRPAVNKKKMNATFSGNSMSYAKLASLPVTATKDLSISNSVENQATLNDQTPRDCQEDVDEASKKVITEIRLETIENITESMPSNDSNEIKGSSSSEQSVYLSAGASSNESIKENSGIQLPDLDYPDFNPFASKSKIRQSPPPENVTNPFASRSRICQTPPLDTENPFATKTKIGTSPETSLIVSKHDEKHAFPNNCTINNETVNIEIKNEVTPIENTDVKFVLPEDKESSENISGTTCSSNNDKESTVQEVNTEDEDTIEGPFLEADDLQNVDKMSNFDGEDVDMMQFSELPPGNEENPDAGELFIDAEAFEFLLNQNKANTVSDCGKESLFLKFDPLFAKRLSSDGVMAALKHGQTQVKQSTPKKDKRPPIPRDATFDKSSPVAGPSGMNTTQDMDLNSTAEESYEDLNVTVSKPMMVVNPAVNPVVTPRNKTMTPVRSNRQSLTFTSPAIAVIDRLLSMSAANNSLMAQDTTVAEVPRDHEADFALTQLRELLADKEISVYNLRSETKELQNRLATLESQMKNLETISEDRLKKINELNEKLNEKSQINKKMAQVVEEYERTIASLIDETEQDKKRHAEERMQLIKERDEQTAHLASMEVSFSDLHSKYEKSKQIIIGFKSNEDAYKKSIKEFEDNLAKMQKNYELLKQHATSKLNHANEELQKINRAHEAEVLKMNAMIKRKELHITSLEETLQQKTKANEELTAICDELINKVG